MFLTIDPHLIINADENEIRTYRKGRLRASVVIGE